MKVGAEDRLGRVAEGLANVLPGSNQPRIQCEHVQGMIGVGVHVASCKHSLGGVMQLGIE